MSALPMAIAFALALNFVLVTCFIFPGWLPSGLAKMAFWVGLAVWGFLIVRSSRELPELVAPRVISEAPDEFPAAHAAYLRGHWERAERLLGDVLAIEHRDPPALLLLAGVYRQTDRLESARMLMKEIGRLEVADHWFLEIAAEQLRLDRAADRLNQAEIEEEKSREERHTDRQDDTPSDSNAADMTDSSRMAA
ncbi:tetratricopeptide repeat protein [Rubripirellula obstinata]|uniref:tetratricopeptide repeat protein n=1 Tax=Rubripirellula obstinata TaxID=406547 RepID=UPI00122C1F90|nr:hypothetical protein [Rubripirellula obstinata]